MKAIQQVKSWLQNEDGATAIEYGLIAAAFGLMLIAVMPTVATELSGLYRKLSEGVESVNSINW
jgi:pilus assembly protein Flp/PilA